jgi:hypothetical protein
MAQAQRDFQAAVAQASDGCNFGQVLSIAAMVATMIVTGGTAAAAVGPALAALQGDQQKNGQTVPVPDTLEGFQYQVKTLVTLGKDASNFSDAFNKVKSSIGQPAEPGLLPDPPNDETKILAQSKDIDAELDKYRSLPAAQAYKALIDNYVATAQAKNNTILQVNALYTAWDNISSQISKECIGCDCDPGSDFRSHRSSASPGRSLFGVGLPPGHQRHYVCSLQRLSCLYLLFA